MPAKNSKNSNATKTNAKSDVKPEVKVDEAPKVDVQKKEDQKVEQKLEKKAEQKPDKKVSAKQEQKEQKEEKKEEADKKQRYFKCIYNGETFGRYSGLKPKQAANKALTSIIKANGGNNECIGKKFKFEMIECTRGGKRKVSLYEGKREKLKEPLEVKIKGEEGEKKIVYNYSNKLHKVKEEKQATGAKSAEKKVKKTVTKKLKEKKTVKKVAPKKKAVSKKN